MANFIPPLSRNNEEYHDFARDTRNKTFKENDTHKAIKDRMFPVIQNKDEEKERDY